MSKEEERKELCSSKKKNTQNILFACVDICDSDCEITYFNTKLFKSKNMTAAEDNSGKENFNGRNSKNKKQSKFKPHESCSEIEENNAHPTKNYLMDFITSTHDLPEKMELYLNDKFRIKEEVDNLDGSLFSNDSCKAIHSEMEVTNKNLMNSFLDNDTENTFNSYDSATGTAGKVKLKSKKKNSDENHRGKEFRIKEEVNNLNGSLNSNDSWKAIHSEIEVTNKNRTNSFLDYDTENTFKSDDSSTGTSGTVKSKSKKKNSSGNRRWKEKLDSTDDALEKDMFTDEFDISNVDISASTKKRKKRLSSLGSGGHVENTKEDLVPVRKKRKKISDEDCEDHMREFDIRNLNVVLPFDVDPLHAYFSRPSKPTPKELKRVKKAGIEIKSGAFTAAEDQIIRDNWTRFCKEHDIVIDPFYFFKFPKQMKAKERMNFLQYIAHGLEFRIPHLVHKRFTKVFRNPWLKVGRFTQEEDKILMDYMATSKSKTRIKDLTEILNRDNLALDKRYRCLKQSLAFNNSIIKWDINLVDKLVNCMLKICKLEDVKSLENFNFTTKHWCKFSRRMEIPIIKLQKAWKINIHPRLFSPKSIDTTKMKVSIINTLYHTKETDWKKINWKEIANNFTGFTPLKTYMIFRQSVEFHVPKEHHKNLRKCVVWLRKKIKKGGLSNNMKYQRYKYCNGHVRYDDEDAGEDEDTKH